MSFTLSTFVKFAGAEALGEHLKFRRLALADSIDPEADASDLAKQFKAAWSGLAADDGGVLLEDFDRAEQFANEDAQAVLRLSCLKSAQALAELERWANDRARALAVLRVEPHLFEDAEIQLGVHKLLANRQLWAGYQLPSAAAPCWSENRRADFEAALRGVYQKKAGVRRRLQLEIDERERLGSDGTPCSPVRQVTIYHEGDANREAVFRGEDEVAIEERRPALMAALVFDPSTGTVEVASRGGKHVQHEIAKAFVIAFWIEELELIRLTPARFAVQRLKAPTHLDFQPSDGLRSVSLVGLILKARGADRLDVTLRLLDPSLPMTIWDVAEEQFAGRSPLCDPAMLIVAADIRFEFEAGPGERKPKARTVKLSLDNGSNKARLSERHRRIVDEHLCKWGLTSDTKTEATTHMFESAR